MKTKRLRALVKEWRDILGVTSHQVHQHPSKMRKELTHLRLQR